MSSSVLRPCFPHLNVYGLSQLHSLPKHSGCNKYIVYEKVADLLVYWDWKKRKVTKYRQILTEFMARLAAKDLVSLREVIFTFIAFQSRDTSFDGIL